MSAFGPNGRTPGVGSRSFDFVRTPATTRTDTSSAGAGAPNISVVGASEGYRETCAAEKPVYNIDAVRRLIAVWMERKFHLDVPQKTKEKKNIDSLRQIDYHEIKYLEKVTSIVREFFPDFEIRYCYYKIDDEGICDILSAHGLCMKIHDTFAIIKNRTPEKVVTLLNFLSRCDETKSGMSVDFDIDSVKRSIVSYYVHYTNAKNELAEATQNVENARCALDVAQAAAQEAVAQEDAAQEDAAQEDDDDDWERFAEKFLKEDIAPKEHVVIAEQTALDSAIQEEREKRRTFERISRELQSNIRQIIDSSAITRSEKNGIFRSIYDPILLELRVLPEYIVKSLKIRV